MNQYGYKAPPDNRRYPYEYPIPQYNPFKQSIKHNANAIGLAVALITVCMHLFAFPVRNMLEFIVPIASPDMLDAIYEIALAVIYVVSFMIPCVVAIQRLRMPWNVAFPLRAPKADILISAVFIGLGARILGNVMVDFVVYLVETVTGLVPVAPQSTSPTDMPTMIVYFVSVAVLPSVFEEGLFRGVALQSLRRFGDGFALVVSSILFALMHGNLIQAVYAFPIGLVMGYFVLRTGSVWAGVIIHFINNAAVVGIEIIDLIASVEVAQSVWTVFLGFSFLSSIIAIVYLKIRYGNAFAVHPSHYPLMEAQKYQYFFTSVCVIITLLIAVFQTAMYFE